MLAGIVILLLCCLQSSGAQLPSSLATQQTFQGFDIVGANLTNCGEGTQPHRECVVCSGGIANVTISCRANPKCLAFTWDGTCGHLKGAGVPRVRRPGYIAVVFTAAGSSDVITAAQEGRSEDDSMNRTAAANANVTGNGSLSETEIKSGNQP